MTAAVFKSVLKAQALSPDQLPTVVVFFRQLLMRTKVLERLGANQQMGGSLCIDYEKAITAISNIATKAGITPKQMAEEQSYVLLLQR